MSNHDRLLAATCHILGHWRVRRVLRTYPLHVVAEYRCRCCGDVNRQRETRVRAARDS